MKRVLALMLALLMMLACFAACGNKDEDETDKKVDDDETVQENVERIGNDYNDAYYYENINGNEIRILSFESKHVKHDIVIPNKINGYDVTEIAADAFKSNTNITGVTLPVALQKIGATAFYGCEQLVTVTFPATLQSVGASAFGNCIRLTKAILPASLVSIGESCFYNCKSLTEVSLPASTKEIPTKAFMNCVALKSVTWSVEGTLIGDSAFMGCVALESINIPTTLAVIGDYAFSGCVKITTITIPAGAEEIGVSAFYGCTALGDVTFAATDYWKIALDEDAYDVYWKEPDVTDAAANRAYLTDTYVSYYWKRVLPIEVAAARKLEKNGYLASSERVSGSVSSNMPEGVVSVMLGFEVNEEDSEGASIDKLFAIAQNAVMVVYFDGEESAKKAKSALEEAYRNLNAIIAEQAAELGVTPQYTLEFEIDGAACYMGSADAIALAK